MWVKVVSTIGKLSLSMRDVDQNTGQDLLPSQAVNPSSSNPAGGQGLRGLSGITVKDDDKGNLPRRRPGKRLTSPERWEITQLIKSGVLDVTEYPTFDEEEGVGSHDCRTVWTCTHAVVLFRTLYGAAGKSASLVPVLQQLQPWSAGSCNLKLLSCECVFWHGMI